MKTSSLVWVVAIIAVAIGGTYMLKSQTTPIPATSSEDIDVYASGTNPDEPGSNFSTKDELPLLGGEIVLGTAKDPKIGTYITGFLGSTVYTYAKDINGTSVCYDSCAINWPPYVVSVNDALTVDKSVTGKIGTTARADGSLQVTYNGKPLYFYPKDEKPGDTEGNGIGGLWSVIKP